MWGFVYPGSLEITSFYYFISYKRLANVETIPFGDFKNAFIVIFPHCAF